MSGTHSSRFMIAVVSLTVASVLSAVQAQDAGFGPRVKSDGEAASHAPGLQSSGTTSPDEAEVLGRCPVMGGAAGTSLQEAPVKKDWWPNRLNLDVLRRRASAGSPMGDGSNYAAEFKKLDLEAVKKDIQGLLTTSQDWWPADYGNYGPLFIRLAWHSAGTYRVADGRGGAAAGTIRFAPLNSWPDNVNLDKARRLLWPIKQKYGRQISWADLMVLTGNVALESMGFKTFGFAGGREDAWEADADTFWGPENEWLADKRHSGDRKLENPLGATQMGLIYVNPEGPNGNPDPLAAARDIRETFGRMAMNDEETVALIAGGHTFGKAHGAGAGSKYLGESPEGAAMEEQGLGWRNTLGKGNAGETITSGLEGAWTFSPAKWSHDYFENLLGLEWKQVKGPGGATQWTPKDESVRGVPDAHDPSKSHAPMMFTTDLALRFDPIYGEISKRFREKPAEFEAAFAKAWYKLTHRDMGPYSRCLGPLVPPPQLWQDPVPAVDHELISKSDVADLKSKILASGLTTSQLASTAWASAATFRGTDKRGGANGARIRLAPQKDWAVNQSAGIQKALEGLAKIQQDFNAAQSGGKKVSLADLIVLGGCAAVEDAAKKGGFSVTVPFTPGRTDATQDMTDAKAMAVLEPTADGFRNFVGRDNSRPAEALLVERARFLTLTPPEMTVLLGGMRALGANFDQSALGVFTSRPGTLTNDFFVNLLDGSTRWQRSAKDATVFEGRDPKTGAVKWTGTSVDLVFGANSELRALAEFYACDDAKQKFVDDFVAAWAKVMSLDRFGG